MLNILRLAAIGLLERNGHGEARLRPGSEAGAGDNARVASDAGDAVRRIGVRLSALAQDGLTYAPSEYDLDRYRQVGRLAA